jgi:L-ascorbate metabolism protein UlaG (beta-lactamase superfamily)
MNFKKTLLIAGVAGLFLSQAALVADMQPVRDKKGCYYYSDEDTHVHIDLKKALSTLVSKILAPQKLIKGLVSKFYSSEKKEKLDPIGLLKPTQTVPAAFSIKPKITWIGHATFLIQMDGFNILTDPIFGSVKVGPFTLTERVMPAGIKFEDLPRIDAVVISHDHSDHTDTTTLMALAKKHQPIVFVPEGNKSLFESMGLKHVVENSWWDESMLTKEGRSLTITCLPAYHWSCRFSLGSYRKSLWSSWMIGTQDTHIYFAGDTAYGKHFKEVAAKFPSIDIALMPIAPTCESGENKHKLYHVDALEAVDAFIDLNAKCFVPMHYGTFFLGTDTLIHPINRLHAYWQEKLAEGTDKKLLMARCGEEFLI